jgi:type II secretory pathway pseudopilin PulG
MKKGFSLIELMLAFVILVSAIIAAAEVTYGMPRMLQNGYAETEAARTAHALLEHAVLLGRNNFNALANTGTTTNDGIASSLHIEPLENGASHLTSEAAWNSLEGSSQSLVFHSLITNYKNDANYPCQPFVSGDWAHPRIVNSYRIAPGFLLPSVIPNGHYPISSLAVQGSWLAVGIANTTSAADPAILFFHITDPAQTPAYELSFDNTPISTVGYTALAAGDGYIYAASGFENTYMPYCAYSTLHCRQLQMFSVQSTSPLRGTTFQIPSTSPSLAITAGGAIAGGSAIAYKDGIVYFGLSKTAGGQEFVVIDIHNIYEPIVIGGISIGRSVNAILVSSTTAYIATDDNATGGKAIIAENVSDPAHPRELFTHSFPGAGFVHALASIGTYLYSGRSYANGTSEEFSILSKDSALAHIGGIDIGTSAMHRSVKAIIARDFLAFILTDDQLQIWNVQDASHPAPYGILPLLHGVATSMACRLNTLYIGSVDTDGNGYLTVVTSS